MRQSRAAKVSNPLSLGVGHNDLDLGHLRDMNTVAQSDASVFYNAFVCSALTYLNSLSELNGNLAQLDFRVQEPVD